ncbi:ribonuclease H-like domain-containing protein [Tanacetum coccineum]
MKSEVSMKDLKRIGTESKASLEAKNPSLTDPECSRPESSRSLLLKDEGPKLSSGNTQLVLVIMSLHGYSDGEYDYVSDVDNVTLISTLDGSHPLHLHPNDYVALTVVSVKLKGTENYQVYLNALWKQFDALIELPRCTCHAADDFKKHNQLMKLMQFLMGLDDTYMQIRSFILSIENLPDVRSAYAIISSEESHRIATGSVSGTSQRSQTSAFNINALNRGNFQRSQTSTSFSRPSNNDRPNDNGNRRTARGSNLVCENYGFNGHTIEKCFKIIRYPADLRKRKVGSNLKGKNVSNYVVGSSSSNGFSNEQMDTLISLIKENYVNGKGVHSNMAGTYMNSSTVFNKNFEKFFCSNSSLHYKLVSKGLITDSGANQHITYTDKNLIDVIDISYLKIKVTHPNRIEVFITRIGNMPLTNYLTLYDVLVLLEYCVSLMSVHKVARDSKHVIAFDEMYCYVKNQDLDKGKILGTGKQIGGLYYFDGNQGELVHLDLWGPFKVTSREGFKFFLTIVDDFRGLRETLSYTPQQNGIVERKHIHLLNVARSLLFQRGIPLNVWSECVLIATYLINRLPTSVLNGKSPYDLVYNKLHSLKHLRSFGCLAYATILNSHDKFRSMSEKYVLVGYSNSKKGYKLWSLNNKQIIYSRDVKFFEDIFPFKQNNSTRIDNSIQDVNHMNFFNTNTLDYLLEITNDEERRNPSLIRHGNSPSHSGSTSAFSNENDARHSQDADASASENGSFAADEENNSNYEGNGLHDQSQDNAIGSKWVWKIKYKSDGEIERYKARLVAKGFNQRERIDFDETFSHVVKIVIVRHLINLVVQNGWSLFQMDINNAFLYGDLEETIYMTLPPGYFPDNETKSKSDYSIFTKSFRDVFIALLVYVDDIIITGNSLTEIEKEKPSNFPMQSNISLTSEPSDTDPLLDNPSETALKVIMYLKGSPGKGINVIKGSASSIDLKAYSDADWARCKLFKGEGPEVSRGILSWVFKLKEEL